MLHCLIIGDDEMGKSICRPPPYPQVLVSNGAVQGKKQPTQYFFIFAAYSNIHNYEEMYFLTLLVGFGMGAGAQNAHWSY
mgnify:CR=1 FL=1